MKPSIALKRIRLRPQNCEIAEEIAKKFQLSKISSQVLAARGFLPDENLKQFITPSLREGLPLPSKLLNIELACNLISDCYKNKKKIALCCDFDVDGLSGAAQVYDFFQKVGIACEVFVPDRFTDGYGLNVNMVRTAREGGCDLLLTIDFGTKNSVELLEARSLGMNTIVLDHHFVGDTQVPADAFINPSQPGCGFAGEILCAAGLSWYLVVALKDYLFSEAKFDAKSYLDLACLGTICDMVPLIGPNRIIAKRGLELLTTTTRVGLQALKKVMGARGEMGCHDVSFGIGPRINAAGRLVHGKLVLDLLTTTDSEEAKRLAKTLNDLNSERQEKELVVKEAAARHVAAMSDLPAGIVVWDETFHTGVIGIVAQRMVELYYRPTIILGADSNGVFKGSVRGVKGFSVVDALSAVGDILLKYGGHHGAGGLSIEEKNLPELRKRFEAECSKSINDEGRIPYIEADTEMSLADYHLHLVQEFKKFAPFGMGNSNPIVLTRSLKVIDVKSLKNAHLKATFTDGRRYITGVMWRQSSHPELVKGNEVNIAYRPEVSMFNGVTELQANLQAIEGVQNNSI